MVAVTAALIGFFAFVIMRVTTPQMTTLFTDLSTEDSSAIIKELERQAIPFELRNDGAAIMVPKDKVTRLRMKLAEGGMPKGGGVGYEIFDKSDALGTTSFVQNINHLRALEGELARTIRAIDRVQAALGLDLGDHQVAGVQRAHLGPDVAGGIIVVGEAEGRAAPAGSLREARRPPPSPPISPSRPNRVAGCSEPIAQAAGFGMPSRTASRTTQSSP